MKINLHIIFDHLAKMLIDTNISSGIELTISNTRIFSPDMKTISDDCLYIIKHPDLDLFLGYPTCAPFAIVHVANHYSIPETRDWIIFDPSFSLSQASNALQEVFEYFNSWEQRIYQHFFQNSPIEEIFKICCESLVNPCVLFDSSLFQVVSAGQLPTNLDYAWKLLNKYDYIPLELVSSEQQECTGAIRRPALYYFPEYTSMWTGLYNNDKIIGYLGATDINQPHSYGQLSIFYCIQLILQNSPVITKLIYRTKQQNGFILKELLLERPVKDSVVEHYLAEMNWLSTGTFQLVYLFSNTSDSLNRHSSFLQRIILDLTSVTTNDFVTPYDNGILILLHYSENTKDNDKEKLHCIKQILPKYDLSGTISYSFDSIKDVFLAYKQCLLTRSVISGINQLHYFSDHYEQCVLHELGVHHPLECYVHSGIKKLFQKKQGFQLIHTLRIFLVNGRNIALTAEQLFIHRNTLTYRIHQIEHTLEVNLMDIDEKTLFELYLSCIILDTNTP